MESPDTLFHFLQIYSEQGLEIMQKKGYMKKKIITSLWGREMDNPHLLLKEIYSLDLAFRGRWKKKYRL